MRNLRSLTVLPSLFAAAQVASCGAPMETELGTTTEELPIACGGTDPNSSCVVSQWSGGRIPYKFVGCTSGCYDASGNLVWSAWTEAASTWNAADKTEVTTAMNAWKTATGSVVRFEPATASDTKVAKFLDEIGTGCNATRGAGNQIVRLRQCGSGPILHEIGHLIGLPHVHQRSDADRYVNTRTNFYCTPPDPPANHCQQNVAGAPNNPVDNYCGYGNYNTYRAQLVSDNIFKCAPGAGTDYGPFDFNSLMLYGSAAPNLACAPALPNECGKVTRAGNAFYSGGTTISRGDVSAVIEMQREAGGWSRFQSIYRMDPGSTQPLDTKLTSTVTATGSPSLSRWGTSGAVAVVRGNNDHYYAKYNSSGGQQWPAADWVDLGGDFKSDPAAVSWGPGRLDFVGIGSDGNVWHHDIDNGVWDFGGGNLGRPPGTSAVSAPAIASWGPDRLDIFVRVGTHLYQKTWAAGWSTGGVGNGWFDRGGDFKGKPGAVSWGVNRIDIVGVGVDNAVWHKAYHGGTNWDAAYEPIFGSALNGTGPVITSKGVDHLNVYITGSDGRVWHDGYAGSWGGWTNLGGSTNDSPGATHTTGNFAYVSARLVAWDNTAAGIWTKRW